MTASGQFWWMGMAGASAFHPLLIFRPPSARSECGSGCGSSRRCLWRENEPHHVQGLCRRRRAPNRVNGRRLLGDIRPALARQLRDAGRQDKDQAQDERPDAPQELPNRRHVAAHRRRELLSLGPQAAGQRANLIVIESAAAAAAFKHACDVQYDTGEALAAGAKQ
jgi:hypothetical protein